MQSATITPRGNQAGERYAEILRVAAELFRRNGYTGTSVQDVADVLGINKASLYHYVTGKEDLLWAVVRDVTEAFGVALAAASDRTHDSGLDAVEDFVRTHAMFNARNAVKALVYERDSHRLKPELYDEIVATRDEYERLLRERFDRGRDDGSIRAELTPAIAIKLLFGMTNWVYHWYDPAGWVTPEQLGDQIASMARRSIEARP
ncbi:TetR/AcrR family transcriptional regulator [Microbacterium sp. CPCC 204701]|uniref:TetR/AcrR family transcriptional regulator n=1 Tax=Microbacterium sp. CPCC 204701 TaxID=2493084 RepID=UPI000FDB6480|nr:TetR/AcrR family transcriptional regulator [Microbacterium sp. CPCC 204701]